MLSDDFRVVNGSVFAFMSFGGRNGRRPQCPYNDRGS